MSDSMHGRDQDAPGDTLLACYARLPIWVPWFLSPKSDGGFAKLPFIMRGATPVRSAASAAASTLERATCAVDWIRDRHICDVGLLLGRVLPRGETLLALDFDAARNIHTGEIQKWAVAMLAPFDGLFVQLSPSNTGIHVLLRLAPSQAARIRDLMRNRQRVSWKREPIDGGKQPGLDLLIGNFVAFTGNLLSNSARIISPPPMDALEDLILRAAPAFAGHASADCIRSSKPQVDLQSGDLRQGPESAPMKPTSAPDAPVAQQRSSRFVASASRTKHWARALDDEDFQMLAAFGAYSRRVRNGRAPVWVAHTLLCQLPGRSQGTYRGAATIATTIKRLMQPALADGLRPGREPLLVPLPRDDFLALVEPRERSAFDARIRPYSMTPWRVPPPRGLDQPPVVRMPLATWKMAVWTLTPFALRLFAYLRATHALERCDPTLPFTLEPGKLAQALRCDRDRIAPAAHEVVAAGLLELVTPSCRSTRRPASFRWPGP